MPEPGKRCQRQLDGVVRQLTGFREPTTKTAQHLLIVERRQRAREAFIGNKANRVGADIDDGNRAIAFKTPLTCIAFRGRGA
jgi:hypothetical protein